MRTCSSGAVGPSGPAAPRAKRQTELLRSFAQALQLGDPSQALERALFDAARLGHRKAQVAGRLLDGPLALAVRAEAGADDLHLLGRQGGEALLHDASGLTADGLLLERDLVHRKERPQRGLPVLADAGVQGRQHLLVGRETLDLVGVGVQLVGQLVQRGLTAQPERHLTLGAPKATHALRDVRGEPHGPARVVQAALKRLADPDRGVGREAVALAVVELLRGADEAEHAFLNEIGEGQALALVLPGHRDDETQVRVDQEVLGVKVPLSMGRRRAITRPGGGTGYPWGGARGSSYGSKGTVIQDGGSP